MELEIKAMADQALLGLVISLTSKVPTVGYGLESGAVLAG